MINKYISPTITAFILCSPSALAEINIYPSGSQNENITENSIAIGTQNNLNGATKGIVVGNNGKLINSDKGIIIGSGTVTNGDGISIGGGESQNGGIAIGSDSKSEKYYEMNIGNRQITGVNSGVADTDAVNVRQLNQMAQNNLENANIHINKKVEKLNKSFQNHLHTIENNLNETVNSVRPYINKEKKKTINEITHYTNKIVSQSFNDSLEKTKHYTDTRYNQLNRKLTHNYNLANAGISGAMAMSAIPQKFGYEKSFGMAVSSFHNQNALAIGAEWNISARTVTHFNASIDTLGGVGIAAGLAFGAN
ncbi:hypothetical protein Xvie_02790 [Xenorhabdus vietnamensis]|uniref:Trimeric autotransporter adhesin YadA-like stalk domain-containing protein n=1 Tax=Xenorhabdus vietnamensis TaxID=351656 RepID=A0A1Y2SC35_9GAMM|nr:YadA-like family protein [Xenorhabdus vietnamensis]OTA15505.1 hypothetical protein Xvie_02790 [Xenorhabdus vietnamensis]